MSTTARPVVKASTMPGAMQEFAIIAAQEAIAAFATEQEIASSIKAKIEQQYPAVYVVLRDGGGGGDLTRAAAVVVVQPCFVTRLSHTSPFLLRPFPLNHPSVPSGGTASSGGILPVS